MKSRFFSDQYNLKFAGALFSLALVPFLPGCVQVPQALQDKLDARFEEITDNLEKEAKTSIAAASEKNDLALTEISAKTDSVLRKAVEEIQQKYDAELAAAGKRLERLAEQRILLNEKAAEEAFAAAQTVQDVATAKLYCLNAINHFPGKASYFQKLVEIQSSDADAGVEDWRQVRSVLELGLYQVAGKTEIEELQKLLAQTDEKIDAFEKSEEGEALKRENEARKVLIAKVNTELELDRCGADMEMLNERLAILETLAEVADAEADAEWVKNENRKTSVRIEYYAILKQCENYRKNIARLIKSGDFSELENGESELVFAVAGMISANNNLLTSLGTLDADALPMSYESSVKIAREELSVLEKTFNEKRSESALANIKQLEARLKEIDERSIKNLNLPEKEYTKKIADRQEVFEKIVEVFSRVYTDDGKEKLEKVLKAHKEIVEGLQKERYKAYQIWATNKIFEAAKSTSRFIGGNGEAKEIVETYLFAIDASLLEPNIASFYQKILDLQIQELEGTTDSWKHSFEIRKELADAPKKSLEDF